MAATLIGIDAGTTGVTCVLFDADLVPRKRAYREFPQHFPRPGEVEHDAAEILAAVDATLTEVLADPAAADVRAIGVTNQRETVFALDRATGRPLRRGIVWQDRRTTARCAELRAAGEAERIAARTGLVVDPYFSATKIEWMLKHDERVRAAAASKDGVRFVTVDALVIAHLTGGGPAATDPTNASRTMLYDIDARAWSLELLELFGIEASQLPELRASVDDFGATSAERYGRALPIRGVAGDQQAALYGQGCWEAQSFKVTFGTGCFLLLNTGERRIDSTRGLVTTLAVNRAGEPCYAIEGSVFVAGAALQWLRDELHFFDDASQSEVLARSVADTGGVFFVPAFTGLGAPHWDPEARGALLGLTRGSGQAHIARAALEAIAFQNAELIELLRSETGLAIESLLADGGATANDLLMQLQADLAGVRVNRGEHVEATARGAAALAGVGVGLLQDPGQAAVFRQAGRTFEPELGSAERTERLREWRRAVERLRGC